jgi:hypothetical protein
MWLEGVAKLKKFNDLNGSRTSDLLAFSIVLKVLEYPVRFQVSIQMKHF